jgi:hypothetical protein
MMVHNPVANATMTPKLDKPPGGVVADDRCTTEAARAHTTDDKLRALKQHQCAPSVQLQAIQEMWNLFSNDDCQFDDVSYPDNSDSATQLNMMVSKAVVQGVESPRLMKMWGEI